MPQIIFMTECAVDGCYKKHMKYSALCKQHQAEYDSGKILTAFYGKRIQKKEFQKTTEK